MIWQLPDKEVKQFDNFVLATTSNCDEQSITFDQLFDQTEDYFWVATFERCIQGLSILEALQVLLIRLQFSLFLLGRGLNVLCIRRDNILTAEEVLVVFACGDHFWFKHV